MHSCWSDATETGYGAHTMSLTSCKLHHIAHLEHIHNVFNHSLMLIERFLEEVGKRPHDLVAGEGAAQALEGGRVELVQPVRLLLLQLLLLDAGRRLAEDHPTVNLSTNFNAVVCNTSV